MFKRIVVAYDGSTMAKSALATAIDLAKRLGVDLYSISVEEHLPRYAASISEVEGAKEQIDAHFRALTKCAHDAAAVSGVEHEAVIRRENQVDEILAFAREGKFDLLIVGSHGHGRVLDRLIGSTSLSVARATPCSVLIVRPSPTTQEGLGQIKRILVGLDGSPLGRVALRAALDLAVLCGAAIIGATVREASPLSQVDASYIETVKDAACEHARAAGTMFEHVTLVGHAAQALCHHAQEASADLIVVGATGLEHPWSLTLGGTATGIASDARCSVLLMRPAHALLHMRDVMVRAVSSVRTDAPLVDVVELLLRRDLKALPVLDARQHVVGIITGGDLLSRGGLELRLSVKKELDAETLREHLRALGRSQKLARDVMTRHVHTIDADADLAAAIRLMAIHNVKRLPVLNQEKQLAGIVSRADVLRTIAALPQPAPHVERDLPAIGRTVASAATRDVPIVQPDTPAEEVLERVLESDLRRVVVADVEGHVHGLISDRDVLARSSPDASPWIVRMLRGQRQSTRPKPLGAAGRALTATDLMAPLLITVRPEDSLTHAIRQMMQHRVKRLIVIDGEGRFQGLVDRREILRLLAGESR